MKSINIFKKVYYSIIGKKYKEMIADSSWWAIAYLAVPEIIFSIAIAIVVTIRSLDLTLTEIYEYVQSFLLPFFFESLSLTFDSILLITIVSYIFQLIKKKRVNYSKLFSLGTYASTLPIILKYIFYVLIFLKGYKSLWFNIIYLILFVLYYVLNYKSIKAYIKENS